MSIEAMKHYEAALKAAFPSGATGDVFHHWNEARKAIEQAEQAQPVAFEIRAFNTTQALIKRADVAQEKADVLERGFGSEADVTIVPLYTAPPPRQPLTDEQKDAARWRFLVDNSYDKEGVTQFHVWEHSWMPHSKTFQPTEWKQRVRGPSLDDFIDRAIEAKLKEKNT
jgi:hypothetical protein